MRIGLLFGAWLVALALGAAVLPVRPAQAQANFDRPGGDYLSAPVVSGDPAECALVCERDRRCRAWTFAYPSAASGGAGFVSTLVQIGIIDIVFSLDSVITAVGMADQVEVMVLAIVIAVLVMMFAAKAIGDFVDAHPTIKMLALSFLILVGVALIGEGFGMHIPKGYIYFAMAFSVVVEMLNLRLRRKREPVRLHKPGSPD